MHSQIKKILLYDGKHDIEYQWIPDLPQQALHSTAKYLPLSQFK